MSDEAKSGRKRWIIILLTVAVLTAVATAGVMLLYGNISERKAEAQQVAFQIVELDENSIDPAEWGKNFPKQYDGYIRTVDMEHTRYGGSEADPNSPHNTTSKIEADPRLAKMWAGYAFAIDFREERGHAFMLSDQRETKRVTERKQPGACVHCHAANTVAYRTLGIADGAPGSLDEPLTSPNGYKQLDAGFVKMSAMPYSEATALVDHPVACIDCHDPKSLQLRVTRPGFLRGIRSLAESDDPVPHLPSVERWRKGNKSTPYDPNKDASRQEMRSMTCGQCHVEYYCGPKATLFFPWERGLKMEQIEAVYDDYTFADGTPFSDFKHAATGAPVVKAQHPEFELWSQGIHARSGVSCADCHMPYVREGAVKISDHHVRSPLLNISRACQTCHRRPEADLQAAVTQIQDRTSALMDRALDALMALITETVTAKKAGVTPEQLAQVFALQRKAQWRIDFINAENSMGFHAPQEAARILGEAIDYARQGQLVLRDLQPLAPKAAPAPEPSVVPTPTPPGGVLD